MGTSFEIGIQSAHTAASTQSGWRTSIKANKDHIVGFAAP
jgi:hypothetical protein